ncbi:XdhC family protein [Deltaproteobacteria bacterium OttesenSCG-928-K17]|nr:XdhC family protein [Deltaproteobacteria bacterium OttesenSCG-928-K17]
MKNIWSTLGRWAESRHKGLTVTLVEAGPADSALVGLMALVEAPGGEPFGPLTESPFWPADLEAVLADALSGALPEEGRLAENQGRRYYVAPMAFSRRALILGGGHVGSALAELLRFLTFEVAIMDDRPEFAAPRTDGAEAVCDSYDNLTARFAAHGFEAVVIVTRGHAQDSACLRQVLSWPATPPYVGMIGSRSRTRETMEMLSKEGFSPEKLGLVHTPIGLKIGAQTPAEIAVSIAAEIIQEFYRDR